MPHDFQGWKRKLGVLTLALACVLIVLWVRSSHSTGEILFRDDKTAIAIASSAEGIILESRYYFDGYATGHGDASNRIATVPYLTSVGFSILISAWLLLSKPRVGPTTGATPALAARTSASQNQ